MAKEWDPETRVDTKGVLRTSRSGIQGVACGGSTAEWCASPPGISPEACSQGGLASAPGDSDLVDCVMAFPQLVQISLSGQELSGANIEAQTKYAAPLSNVLLKKCPLSQLWKTPSGRTW